jgi:hypothetical protein
LRWTRLGWRFGLCRNGGSLADGKMVVDRSGIVAIALSGKAVRAAV